MQKISDVFTLSNGYTIPCLGFGTWQTQDGEEAVQAVINAVKAGYRHIDTAACYKNERGVGTGIARCGIPREELFITSKVWNTSRGYESTKQAFAKTLEDLQLDYLDLYLIHWPASSHQFSNYEELNVQTWQAMCELYNEGKIKAIGVSNFKPHHLEPLLKSPIIPMVNQIEFHPGFTQDETVAFCKKHNILVEAWAPLGTGRVLHNRVLEQIAAKYHKSVAQVCIRYCLDLGTLPLPKSVNPSRIIENTQVFDFKLAPEDFSAIQALGEFAWSGQDPDKVDF